MTELGDGGGRVGGWRVTSQQETQEINAAGSFVAGFDVYFQTAGGNTGHVFIPHVNYDPLTVRAAIAYKAAQLDAVSNLTG